MTQLIATTTNTGSLGRLVCWDQNGYVNYDEFVAALEQYNLPKDIQPTPTTPETSLERAIADVVPSKRGRGGGTVDVTKLSPKGTRDKVYIISRKNKNHDEETVLFEQNLKVRLNAVGILSFEPQDHPAADSIKTRYSFHQDHLNANDTSSVYTQVINMCCGTRIRQRGGMYFIAKTNLALWNNLVSAVESCSDHVFHAIPADDIECVRKVIISGIVSQINSDISKIEGLLERDNIGKRALETQLKSCNSLHDKMSDYKSMLGEAFTDLSERLETLEGNIAHMALLNMGMDKGKEAA